MSEFAKDSIHSFLGKVGSKSPTPGGGTVAAMTGAMAASLVEMVCVLTIGKTGYEDVWAEMESIRSEVSNISKELLDLADDDAKAYDGVVFAFRLPKGDAKKEKKIQDSLKKAALIPLETARRAAAVLDFAENVLAIGNKNASSDAKTAIYLSKAAIKSALENVEINLASIKDRKFKGEIKPSFILLTKKAKDKAH